MTNTMRNSTIAKSNLSAHCIDDSCSGVYQSNPANMTNILVGCGLMRSVPQKQGDGDSWTFDTGSRWSQKLYTCASAISASVKTVSFEYNRTDGLLSTLAVSGLRDKEYDKTGPPTWAVQDTGLRYRVMDTNPLWGLVAPRYQNISNLYNIRTLAQSRLYVPGWVDPEGSTGFNPEGNTLFSREDVAGSDFAAAALSSTYCSQREATCSPAFDYFGQSDLAMWARWKDLSSSARTASLIPNLIWTDISASAVAGTKGIKGTINGGSESNWPRVVPFQSIVRYHYAYAVPAALAAVLLLAILCSALVMALVAGRGSLATMRRHLQQLSPGRIYTVLLLPEREGSNLQMCGKDWNRRFGQCPVDLSDKRPSVVPEPSSDDGDDDDCEAGTGASGGGAADVLIP